MVGRDDTHVLPPLHAGRRPPAGRARRPNNQGESHLMINSFVSQYALFLAEAAILVLAVIALVAGLSALSRRKNKHSGETQVTDINRQIEAAGDKIDALRLPEKALKGLHKQRKAKQKARRQRSPAATCSTSKVISAPRRSSRRTRKSAPSCRYQSRVTRSCCGWRARAAWSTATASPPPSRCGCATPGCRSP